MRWRRLLVAGVAVLAIAEPVRTLHAARLPPGSPASLCTRAIDGVERSTQLPPRLLGAIAFVESGRRVPGTTMAGPWPWTINVNGTGFFFDSKDQAIAAVQALQAQGVQSIDVGCMQVNLFHHARAFASLDAAFDPQGNVSYAARFLRGLYAQTGTWPRAAAAYHSQTPELGADYLRRVMAWWPEGQQFDAAPAAATPRLYTPELASRIADDRAGLQQVLARMRLPVPTDMAARQAALARWSLAQTSRVQPRQARSGQDRSGQAGSGQAGPRQPGFPVPNRSALAAFQPSAAAPTIPGRTTLHRKKGYASLASQDSDKALQ